jgi:hypothetical protein
MRRNHYVTATLPLAWTLARDQPPPKSDGFVEGRFRLETAGLPDGRVPAGLPCLFCGAVLVDGVDGGPGNN